MKTLKFSSDLVPLILSGKKITTWRLFDDKNLQKDDELLLVNRQTNEIFAKAIIVEIKEKTFKDLTEDDFKGKKHEKFSNDEEMLKMYSNYYKTKVTLNTPLKIIKFKLLK